jgi:hypothetical protein
MAKVKFSALISEMRNKLNGSVFARNRGGAYLRTKVTPVNPSTIEQVIARNRLTAFSQRWRTLTEAQRAAWNGAVNQWTTTDVFGDVVKPSGNALFNRLNINVQIAGGSVLATPPSPVGAEALTDLSVTAAAGTAAVSVEFAPAAVPTDHVMFLESTAMLSPGISNASAQYRKISVLPAAEASPYDALAEQTAKFGGLVEGQKLFVRAKFINSLTGEVSQRLTASTIVAA